MPTRRVCTSLEAGLLPQWHQQPLDRYRWCTYVGAAVQLKLCGPRVPAHCARLLFIPSVFFFYDSHQLACSSPTSARRRFLSVDGSGRLFPAARWLWRRSEADLESTLWRGHRLVQSVESVQLEAKAAQGGVRTPPQAASSSATPALHAPRREESLHSYRCTKKVHNPHRRREPARH